MDSRDLRATIDRYQARLSQHGPTPQALGWGQHGKQAIRFAALTEQVLRHPGSSVLDAGCGFADLFTFLLAHGWKGRYTGVDLVPALLDVARQRHTGIDVRELDITTTMLEPHDFVIASGIANRRLEHAEHREYVSNILGALFAHARVAVAIDFLSTWVDFQRDEAWHTDPAWLLTTARTLTRRVTLKHDYLPYEFAVLLQRSDDIVDGNTFRAY